MSEKRKPPTAGGAGEQIRAAAGSPRTLGWNRLRLSTRLALLVFLAEFFLLGAFAISTYAYSRKHFYDTFDSALRANAEALAATVSAAAREGGAGTDLAGKQPQFLPWQKDDNLFAVMHAKGKIIARSEDFGDLPDWAKRTGEGTAYGSFRFDGRRYRGILLAPSTENRPSGKPAQARPRVFFASRSRKMDDRLEDVAEFLAFAVGALLLASGGLAWIIARGGLAPVRKLARETDRIGERSLHLRLATERVPPDLIPLAKAVNALLKRLTAALDRERQFSADAAHELRTPVAVLKSGVQAALLTKRRVADDQKAFEELLDEVKRLEKLCESLLLIASPERDGKPEALLDPRDWIACVAETVEDFRTLALANESELSFHPPSAVSGSVALRTDEATARRITANLVENAIRHGGGGVRIDVTVSLDAEGASLVVEDNGVGIAPENEDRLFDRFFRADKARARATGGVGLGLAISRALAEAAGGSVRYERPPQRGSRFIWSVALARDAETAA